MRIPKNIATSAILSNTESKKPPVFEILFVYLATCPSTIAKKPETFLGLMPNTRL